MHLYFYDCSFLYHLNIMDFISTPLTSPEHFQQFTQLFYHICDSRYFGRSITFKKIMETSRMNLTMNTYIYSSNSSHNYRYTHTYIRAHRSI